MLSTRIEREEDISIMPHAVGSQLRVSKYDVSDPSLLMDTYALFSGEKSGHMARHAFRNPQFEGDPAGGLVFWQENVDNPDFPANLEAKHVADPNTVRHIMGHITGLSRHISIIEVGNGLFGSTKVKTVPYMQHFLTANGQGERRQIEYIAIDTAEDLAETAADKIRDEVAVSNSGFLKADFTKIQKKVLTEGHPSVAVLWGGTLWNAPTRQDIESDYVIASQLSSLGKLVDVGGYAIISYYGTHGGDIAKTLAPYQTPSNEAAVRSILYAIKQDVEPAFDPESFDIVVEFNKNSGMVTMSAQSKIEQDITLPMNNYRRHLKAGEKLTLVNSAKKSFQTLEELSRKADFRIIADVENAETNTGVVLMQYRPR